jgi:hypothetical protein
MSELKITKSGRVPFEVLAAGTMVLTDHPPVLTFEHGGQSLTVHPLMDVPPRGPNGHYLLPLPEGALLPGGDAYHKVGEVTVAVQLRKLARHASNIGAEEFLFSYEVTRPVAVPHLRSVA